jgi:uncharacterized protein (UPF0210 family)
VLGMRSENAAQVPLAEDDHMVEAVASADF